MRLGNRTGIGWRTAIAAALLPLALTGCGDDAVTGGDPGSTTQEGEVRTRLAAALADVSRSAKTLVADPATRLTPVDTPWLVGWQVYDVENPTPPHPRRFYVALSDDGSAAYLSGRPTSFNDVVRGATRLDAAETAVAIAETYLDVTRDFRGWSYRVSSLDEVQWRPKLSDEQRAARDRIRRRLGDELAATRPERTPTGWEVTLWAVEGSSLAKHVLAVAENGTVTDTRSIAAEDLPVPGSI